MCVSWPEVFSGAVPFLCRRQAVLIKQRCSVFLLANMKSFLQGQGLCQDKKCLFSVCSLCKGTAVLVFDLLLIFWKWNVLDTQSQRIGAGQPGGAPAFKVSSAGSSSSFAKTNVFTSLLSMPPSLGWGSVGRIRSITSISPPCKFLLWDFWTGITVVKYSCIFSSKTCPALTWEMQ